MKNIGFFKKLGLNSFALYKNIQKELHDLNYLFWECTFKCSLSCKHCGSDCKTDAKVKDMPLCDFTTVLKSVSKKYNPNKVMLVLSGGEPLLRNDLEECGRTFYNMGFPWGIVSNGYALNQSRFDALINAGMRSITISLDGLKESHNWLRGKKDSFDRAVRSIEIINKNREVVSDVVTCVNSRNISELDSFKTLLLEKGARNWRLFTIFPRGRARDDEELKLSNADFRILMEFIVKTNGEGLIRSSYGCEGFLGKYENVVRNGYFFCRAGVNIGSVLADGSISACPSLRGDFIQGNIYKEDFLDVWENRYSIMRDRKWTRKDQCADCDVYKWCEGNGLHLWDEETKTLCKCHYKDLFESA